MAEQITVDRTVLEGLARNWGQREADSQDRLSSFSWEGGNRGDLGVSWVTKLGAEGYATGKVMSDKVEQVRAGLAERIQAFGDASYNLRHGLNGVLSNGDDAENFNTLTGDEFNASLPASGG